MDGLDDGRLEAALQVEVQRRRPVLGRSAGDPCVLAAGKTGRGLADEDIRDRIASALDLGSVAAVAS